MKKATVICLIFFSLLQGCSVLIAEKRNKKRAEVHSKAVVGTPRSEIAQVFGKPIKSEGENIEVFNVCVPKYSEGYFNLVMDIALVGFWELVATPYELATPCEYKAEWTFTYDENDRVKHISRKAVIP